MHVIVAATSFLRLCFLQVKCIRLHQFECQNPRGNKLNNMACMKLISMLILWQFSLSINKSINDFKDKMTDVEKVCQ